MFYNIVCGWLYSKCRCVQISRSKWKNVVPGSESGQMNHYSPDMSRKVGSISPIIINLFANGITRTRIRANLIGLFWFHYARAVLGRDTTGDWLDQTTARTVSSALMDISPDKSTKYYFEFKATFKLKIHSLIKTPTPNNDFFTLYFRSFKLYAG